MAESETKQVAQVIVGLIRNLDADCKGKTRDERNEKKIAQAEMRYDLLNDLRDCMHNLLREDESQVSFALTYTMYIRTECRYFDKNTKDKRFIELYYKTLLVETPFWFESYMEYLEMKRPYAKQFYAPRRDTLHQVAMDLQRLEDDPTMKFYGLSMPARVGKLLSDDTPVLTTNGWKNHGDLVEGDYVYDYDGLPVRVIYVHPKNYANKRVWFTDGSYIDCHENHEWIIYDRCRGEERIAETKEMTNALYKGRCKYQIPNYQAILGEEKDLPVAPYTLGVWLGDGTNRKPLICEPTGDLAIIDSVVADGYKVCNHYIHKDTGVEYFAFADLRSDLQKADMCYSRRTCIKHIPDIYFSASIPQRLELLAGLLDTDGCLVKKEHRYHFSTTEEALRDDFVALVNTFGWRCSVSSKEPTTSSSGIHGNKTVYVIGFNPTHHIPCRLERKQLFEFSKKHRLGIKRIEDIEPKQGNCITVQGGIYRAGRHCIPTHNSTICIFFLSWIMLKRPNSHSAMIGHSGILAKGFFKEVLNIVSTKEYTYAEMYSYYHPNHMLLREKSAEDFTITLDAPDRFATLTCRGIDGTLTGAVDISGGNNVGYLYIDDLVRDREHSLSPQRMENTWQEYNNKCVDRKNTGAKELMVGTLWNVLDPLEKMRNRYEGQDGYVFRRIPALNEKDESNFNYDVNGFTTEYYRDMRERLDDPEWCAKYQQSPYLREGLLFRSDELRYFNGILPDGDHRIVAVVDVAWGGGDSLSMPIGAEYENGDVYIFAWVFNRGAKEITLPLVTGQIIGNEIRQIRFEGNTGGDLYCQYVDERLRENNYKCSCTSRKAPTKMAKSEKIYAYSGDIKRNFIFIEPKRPTEEELRKDVRCGIKRYIRNDEYQRAMDELTMFVTIGDNEHDDAPDGLTQLAMFIEGDGVATVEAIHNPFWGMR